MKYSILLLAILLSLKGFSQPKSNSYILISISNTFRCDSIFFKPESANKNEVYKIIDYKSILHASIVINHQFKKEEELVIFFKNNNYDISDSLYFVSNGKHGVININDSVEYFKNKTLFTLKNVSCFEELYPRFNKSFAKSLFELNSYYRNNRNKIEIESAKKLEKAILVDKLNFLKKNLTNFYAADLFKHFVINQPNVDYNLVKNFYQVYMKFHINKLSTRKDIASEIEKIKIEIKENAKVPNFNANDIKGNIFNSEALKGNFYLINFWATWCKPCLQEIPAIKLIANKYKNLKIISVSLDKDSNAFRKMIAEKEMNWTHILNNKSMLDDFKVNPIPMLYLVDEQGVIVYNKIERTNETDQLVILNTVLENKLK